MSIVKMVFQMLMLREFLKDSWLGSLELVLKNQLI